MSFLLGCLTGLLMCQMFFAIQARRELKAFEAKQPASTTKDT